MRVVSVLPPPGGGDQASCKDGSLDRIDEGSLDQLLL